MTVRYTAVEGMDDPALRELDRNADRWRDKIEVRLDNRQVFFLFFGSAVVACMLFVLGVMVGKRIESRGQAAAPEMQDPLAALASVARVVRAGGVVFLTLPDAVRLKHDMSSLRCAIHAAAPCPIPIKEKMIEWWGPIVWEYYGGTEGNGLTMCNATDWLVTAPLMALSLAAGFNAVRHAGRIAHPLLDLSVFAVPSFAITVSGGVLFRTAISAAPFLLPLMFQLAFGLDPLASGLLLLAVFAGNLAMKPMTNAAAAASVPLTIRCPNLTTFPMSRRREPERSTTRPKACGPSSSSKCVIFCGTPSSTT